MGGDAVYGEGVLMFVLLCSCMARKTSMAEPWPLHVCPALSLYL